VTTILILEDNPVVRQMLGFVLCSKGGYRALEAATEDEAVAHMERAHEEIELLIADVCVEDQFGRAIADRLSRLCPRLRVLFVSGYPKDHLVESGWLQPEDAFLAKPFAPERLMRSVKEVLADTCQPHVLSSSAVRTACAGGAA
jgi:two-component system cell cycle sensor histidine kinase/response regulator CckA